MIKVTTLDNHIIYINSFYIEAITKHSPVDSIIRLRSGKTHIVAETPEEIVRLIDEQKRLNPLYCGVGSLSYQEAL
jgi:uncharacterized protein YlzI (FlbEa/FlbD family)